MEIFVYHTPDQVPDLRKKACKDGLQLDMPACAITNGTRALEWVQRLPILMIASLTNRAAVVRYLLQEQPHTVWIVAAGWRGGFSLEDTICAGAIGHLLSVERDSDCAGDDESIAAVALFEQWQDRGLLHPARQC